MLPFNALRGEKIEGHGLGIGDGAGLQLHEPRGIHHQIGLELAYQFQIGLGAQADVGRLFGQSRLNDPALVSTFVTHACGRMSQSHQGFDDGPI